jgi:hypothetical protein
MRRAIVAGVLCLSVVGSVWSTGLATEKVAKSRPVAVTRPTVVGDSDGNARQRGTHFVGTFQTPVGQPRDRERLALEDAQAFLRNHDLFFDVYTTTEVDLKIRRCIQASEHKRDLEKVAGEVDAANKEREKADRAVRDDLKAYTDKQIIGMIDTLSGTTNTELEVALRPVIEKIVQKQLEAELAKRIPEIEKKVEERLRGNSGSK